MAFLNSFTSILGAFGGSGGVGSMFSTIFSGPIFGGLIDSGTIGTINKYINIFKGFNKDNQANVELRDVSLQTSTYAKIIPEIFGDTRVAGNIIWVSKIKKEVTKIKSANDKFGSPTQSKNKVVITGSFAIAICRGPVNKISAIYADNKPMHMGSLNVALYKGTATQMPNSTMQAHIGVENVPAFRDLCYAVFTDFDLQEFGGKLPNFTFDISFGRQTGIKTAEEYIEAVNIIPGSGEFVYDTIIQYSENYEIIGQKKIVTVGKQRPTNAHNNTNKTNAILSLDHLQQTLPNLKWTSVVVCWFSNSVDASICRIYPACERKDIIASPNQWSVGGIYRAQSDEVSRDNQDRPRYGGTPDDASVLRYIDELKKRKLKVCFNPMLMIDTPSKPWRGRITCGAENVKRFFDNSGYNEFIMHYARLVKDKVDAFIIGSEMIGLTKIRNAQNAFPAVDMFVALAKKVKETMRPGTIITYAADWSEYHHTEGGWYNMDTLWSCPYIDVIGIDAYFPLSNSNNTLTNRQDIINGWTSGEGYDRYYTNSEKTQYQPLNSPYAWKNISWFWSNIHWNPNGTKTSWTPRLKKIWFTEYGFPSVDCTTNSPNKFFSVDGSSESGFPHLSKGNVDFIAQRTAIHATEEYWYNNPMIELKFLWAWDARPYPFFPGLTKVWADAQNWQYGHFINGKLGRSSLGSCIATLCQKAGLRETEYNVSDLDINMAGYIINTRSTAIDNIQKLATIYEFDGYMRDGVIVFKMLSSGILHKIKEEDILINKDKPDIKIIEQCAALSLPHRIEFLHIDRNLNYIVSSTYAEDLAANGTQTYTVKTTLALSRQEAYKCAERIMRKANSERYQYNIKLHLSIGTFSPLDVIQLTYQDKQHYIRIHNINIIDETSMEIVGISCHYDENYKYGFDEGNIDSITQSEQIAETRMQILDINIKYMNPSSLPTLTIAAHSKMEYWNGCSILISYDNGANYSTLTNIMQESLVGKVSQILSQSASPYCIDKTSEMIVILENNRKLESITFISLLNYVNVAIVGNEIISFQYSEPLGENKWKCKNILRGRFGTEEHIKAHQVGESFIMLTDGNITNIEIPTAAANSQILCKAVSRGFGAYSTKTYNINVTAKNLQAFSPLNATIVTSSSGSHHISWISRPNDEIEFWDNGNTRPYRYRIIIKNTNQTILRSYVVQNISTSEYSVADQIVDNGTVMERDKLLFEITPEAIL